MTAQTEAEFSDYLTKNHQYFGLVLNDYRPYEEPWFRPSYDHPEAKTIGLELPDFASGFAYLAGIIPTLVSVDCGTEWRGGAVIYQDYDVWNQANNVQGRTIIERIRYGFGELRPFGQATVNVFRDTDLSILPAFLLAPIIYGWNAYYIPQEKGTFAFISHDGYWRISTETTADYDALQDRLKPYSEEHWLGRQRLVDAKL